MTNFKESFLKKTNDVEDKVNSTVSNAEVNSDSQHVEKDGMPYLMVRTYSAGVYAGYLEGYDGNKKAVLKDARRMRRLSGALEIGEPVDTVYLTEVVEMIPITVQDKKTLDSVKNWNE